MGFVFVYQATYFGRLHHGRIEDFADAILGGEEPEDQDGPDRDDRDDQDHNLLPCGQPEHHRRQDDFSAREAEETQPTGA